MDNRSKQHDMQVTRHLLHAINKVLDLHAMSVLSEYREFLNDVVPHLLSTWPKTLTLKTEYIRLLYIACRIDELLPPYSSLSIFSNVQASSRLHRIIVEELSKDDLHTAVEVSSGEILKLDVHSYSLLRVATHVLTKMSHATNNDDVDMITEYNDVEVVEAMPNKRQKLHRSKSSVSSTSALIERIKSNTSLKVPWLQSIYLLMTKHPSYVLNHDLYKPLLKVLLVTVRRSDMKVRLWALAAIDMLIATKQQPPPTAS